MHPVLAHLGPAVVHSYGVCLVFALSCAFSLVALVVARMPGVKLEHALVPLGVGAFLALFGARAAFIVMNWTAYAQQSLDILGLLTRGGLTYWGAVLSLAIAFAGYALVARVALRDILAGADVAVLALPLATAIGKLGCLLAGCCFGVPSDGPLSLAFPEGSLAYQAMMNTVAPDVAAQMRDAHQTAPLFPLQLVELVGNLVIFAALALLLRARERVPGRAVFAWGVLYPALRLGLKPWRAIEPGFNNYALDVAVWTAVGVVSLLLFVLVTARAQRDRRAALSPASP